MPPLDPMTFNQKIEVYEIGYLRDKTRTLNLNHCCS